MTLPFLLPSGICGRTDAALPNVSRASANLRFVSARPCTCGSNHGNARVPNWFQLLTVNRKIPDGAQWEPSTQPHPNPVALSGNAWISIVFQQGPNGIPRRTAGRHRETDIRFFADAGIACFPKVFEGNCLTVRFAVPGRRRPLQKCLGFPLFL